jgi:hypothetical protein
MTLTVDAVTAISRSVARAYDPRLEVLGVASTDGGTSRVELLVTIEGCHQDPCVIMINVTRSAQPEFEHELRTKFRDALASH